MLTAARLRGSFLSNTAVRLHLSHMPTAFLSRDVPLIAATRLH
jgi:hypothetical protein